MIREESNKSIIANGLQITLYPISGPTPGYLIRSGSVRWFSGSIGPVPQSGLPHRQFARHSSWDLYIGRVRYVANPGNDNPTSSTRYGRGIVY